MLALRHTAGRDGGSASPWGQGQGLIPAPALPRFAFRDACVHGRRRIDHCRSGGAQGTDGQHRARSPALRPPSRRPVSWRNRPPSLGPFGPARAPSRLVPSRSQDWLGPFSGVRDHRAQRLGCGDEGGAPKSRTPLGTSFFLLWSHLWTHWTVAAGSCLSTVASGPGPASGRRRSRPSRKLGLRSGPFWLFSGACPSTTM